MDFRLLGPVEVWDQGERIALSGSKMHTVLAALLLAEGRIVSDERLSALLWGWEPPVTAGAQIYTYMSRLRKQLGSAVDIERRPPGYLLRTPQGTGLDLLDFRQRQRQGRLALGERRLPEAAALLREALLMWRGPALANASEHLREAEAPRLEEERNLALESRIEAELELGGHETLTAELTALVAEFPLWEQLRAQLMTALYRCGRQADALQVYYEGRSLLADELGVDPGEALGATYQAVIGGGLGRGGAGRRSGAQRGGPPPSTPSTLPASDEGFVGREQELAGLRRRLTGENGGSRRVLITGMGGSGKTALALRAAQELAGSFPDGLFFAELSRADGSPKPASAVLSSLLRALGENAGDVLREEPGDLDELIRLYRTRTSERRLLLVLDGVSGDSQLGPLLPVGPGAVLLTGRARLARVSGGATLSLRTLRAAQAQELLAARVGTERLAAEPGATAALVEYCGGLPLALAILGARLAARPHWPVARLAGRLADTAGRLDQFRVGDLDLRSTLASSTRGLGPGALRILAGLGEFGASAFPAALAGEHVGWSETEAENALEDLTDAALLDLAGLDELGRPLYSSHPLVRLLGDLGAPAVRESAPPLAVAG